MGLEIFQVDAFTREPFAGNPAGVCILPAAREEPWMQRVAREMNLSETAFLHREGEGWRLRWFTPAVEVELCGHATLASAHVLWESGRLAPDEPALFRTLSGALRAERRGDGIEMDFPATPADPAEAPPGLREALGAAPVWVGRNRFDLLAVLASEEEVRCLRPDFTRLRAIPARGFIVTARAATPGFDFVSRFFAPAVGVDEDPVTGSAHCTLGPYWGRVLGEGELAARQVSERGGDVRVRLAGERVLLGGHAVTVLRCELLAD